MARFRQRVPLPRGKTWRRSRSTSWTGRLSAGRAAGWRGRKTGGWRGERLLPAVHEVPAEAALDAEVSAGHLALDGGGDLDDPLVLHVDGQRAADAAVGADGVGRGLVLRLPPPG